MDDTGDLLTRAFTDPSGVVETATARLEHAEGAERVQLLRVIGNACRELHQIDESVRHLRQAVDEAVALGDPELEGRCSMSLAASLSYSGQFEE
jgi:hypothetical protein